MANQVGPWFQAIDGRHDHYTQHTKIGHFFSDHVSLSKSVVVVAQLSLQVYSKPRKVQ